MDVKIIVYIIIGLYLIIMSVMDIRSLTIPILPAVIMLIAVSVTLLIAGVTPLDIGLGVLVGVILYLISKLSRGCIGEADAMVYAITGAGMGLIHNLEVLLISLTLSAIVSGFLIVIKRVGRKYRIPFVPFTTVGFIFIILTYEMV